MSEQEIIEKVNQVFEESFEIGRTKLQPRMRIFDDLGLDSLDIVDLVVALQSKFGVKIRDDQRIRDIRTLGDIYQFVLSLEKENKFMVSENSK
ncbi:MAG: phosphopantetheine-binding protein [Elusimicrobiota bacterium]